MREAVGVTATWRRSSFCADNACVEIAEVGDEVLMRDSKNRSQPSISLDRVAWLQFVQGVDNGEFVPL